MRTASPLRYPGGKSCLAGLLRTIRCLNQLGDRPIAEPFAGGAGASLSLLFSEDVSQVSVNDADPMILDFWWAVLHRPKQFASLISRTPLTIAQWRRQRATHLSSKRVSRLRRGFSTFYLNRCNRSGIISTGGPIGGIGQKGKWKVDARYNRPALRRRCAKVAEFRDRIRLSSEDGLEFIQKMRFTDAFFFIDPPYYMKGPSLYLDGLNRTYHEALAKQLRVMSDSAWVLTYDDCKEIRHLYRGWATIRPYQLRYTAAERCRGKELLITPKWMQLPHNQESASIVW